MAFYLEVCKRIIADYELLKKDLNDELLDIRKSMLEKYLIHSAFNEGNFKESLEANQKRVKQIYEGLNELEEKIRRFKLTYEGMKDENFTNAENAFIQSFNL